MIVGILIYLLGSGAPLGDRVVDVDAIERNVCYSDLGDDCFTQYIFWEWLPYMQRFGVVAWHMEDKAAGPPEKRGDWYYLTIQTSTKTVTVRAKACRESRTHTSQDPERRNRYVWPEHLRRGL